MANCVTCGDELHPERAEKYDYCTRVECRGRNAKGLQMVAIGVNKAADQYMVLNERTKQEMASGRYKKEPGVPGGGRPHPVRTAGPTPAHSSRSSPVSRPRWSEPQMNLALIYRSMGMKPDEIARRLGVSSHLVTRMLLAATRQGKR